MAGVILTAIGALIVGAGAAAYHILVPSDHVELGSLHDVHKKWPKEEDAPPIPYPPDYYGTPLYAPLQHGKTHYFLMGPEQGKKIILVHGITSGWTATPAFVHGLVGKGFRVLVYDLYGRGYSDAPGVKYTESLYVNQVKGLLDEVGWANANVIGYSLGGAIATAFTAKFPQYVNKLILFAPAGLPKSLPLMGKIISIPVFGKLFFHSIGIRILPKRADANQNQKLIHTAPIKHSMAVTHLMMKKHPGYPRAYLSTVRHGPVRGMHPRYEKVGKEFGDRILCVWGDQDNIVSFKKDFPVLKKLMPQAKTIVIPEEGHSLVSDYPGELVQDVTDFINQK